MNAKTKISNVQLRILMTLFIIGSSIVLPLAASAGRDSWISIMCAVVIGGCIAWICGYLCLSYPGRSIIEISELLLGRWTGKIIAILYAWYSLHLGALVLRNFSDFSLSAVLPTTPPVVIDLLLIAIVVWMVHGGIEVLGRFGQFWFKIVVFSILITFIFMIPDMKFTNLLPILDKGWAPVVKGTTELVGFPFGETVLFGMIIPYINNFTQTKKKVLQAIGGGGILLLICSIQNILVLGDRASRSTYPTYTAVKYIEIGHFLSGIDPIIIAVWLICIFIKISICLYVSALCLTKTVGSNNYKVYLLPLAILMIELSQWVYANVAEMVYFATNVWQWYSIPFQILIPLLLLSVSIVKKGKRFN